MKSWDSLFDRPTSCRFKNLPIIYITKGAYSFVKTNYLLKHFDFKVTYSYISSITVHSRYNHEESRYLAIKYMPLFRHFTCFWPNNDMCLNYSAPLTAALRSAGINARLVLGKRKYRDYQGFSFHAWIEIDDEPLTNEKRVQLDYIIILRVPN